MKGKMQREGKRSSGLKAWFASLCWRGGEGRGKGEGEKYVKADVSYNSQVHYFSLRW